MVYTYKDSRKCQHCDTPISDQTHALRKSCPRKKLPDGTIVSCKDDFHAAKNKRVNLAYRKLTVHHKSMDERIAYLLRHKGDALNLEDLNRHGIILNRPIEFSKNETGEFIYSFMHHSITQINNNQFKIKTHDSLF